MIVSPLYAIVDAEVLRTRGVSLEEMVAGLRAAGVGLLQYRDKAGAPQEVLRAAAVIRAGMAGSGCRLILNDCADLAVLAGFDGVHVGQGDLLPEEARLVMTGQGVGGELESRPHPLSEGDKGWGTRGVDGGIVGVSTHTGTQVRVAELSSADYVAVGPVFATGTKLDAEAAIGVEGVRRMRSLTTKPVVAIGGITRENARRVLDAGADAVAVISGLLVEGESVERVARDFIEILGVAGRR